ncbi:MAG: histidinol-phosphatase [Anaerotignum sp.]|nr:histidinol-phosphatase [Anaerotignum sp.]
MIKYPKMNLHTHTTYCDGKESVESMIQAAIAKDFVRLGFSGHVFNDFRPEDQDIWCMSPERTQKYIEEVRMMAEKYKEKIEILCGIEQDFCSNVSTDGFDYVIGSVHYAEKDGQYYCVDESPEVLEKAIREGFGGDVYALTKRFFEMEAEVVQKTNATFIGHFDLVTKFNEGNRFFDPMDKRYRHAALEAMDALIETGRPFEINTGGMYRGFRTEAYPSIQLLKDLKERGGSILLSSDSHDGASIGFQFAEAAQAAKEIGFKTVKVLSKDGWDEFEL